MADQDRNDNTNRIQQPQAGNQHPPEWRGDLSPDHMAGQNVGAVSGDREQGLRTAYDVKELHRGMSEWGDDDLKQIPVLPEGERLQQGSTYLDLNNRGRGEFTAMGNMQASSGSALVRIGAGGSRSRERRCSSKSSTCRISGRVSWRPAR